MQCGDLCAASACDDRLGDQHCDDMGTAVQEEVVKEGDAAAKEEPAEPPAKKTKTEVKHKFSIAQESRNGSDHCTHLHPAMRGALRRC